MVTNCTESVNCITQILKNAILAVMAQIDFGLKLSKKKGLIVNR